VTWLIEHSTSHQLLWCIDSFVLRNPPLRQAPKRFKGVNMFLSAKIANTEAALFELVLFFVRHSLPVWPATLTQRFGGITSKRRA
jgi:hypothetical protein